jgi:hypothetical protein
MLFFSILASCNQSQAQQVFEPVAGVRILLSETQVSTLLETLRAFANQEGLRLEFGNYPKRGREVLNLELRKNAVTFFHIGNFRDPDRFYLTAYSHENEEVWKPIWTRLTASMVATFGGSKVSERHFGSSSR